MGQNGPGLFITFEGGEGAGKTTQIKLLADFLSKHHESDVVTTREPGGTPEAESIRNLLVQRDGGDWTAESETLLFFAARHMHVQRVIKPALQEGKIVICDRFTDSTRAYQAYGHGQPIEFVERLNRLVLDGFDPDLTFILDIAPETGLIRSRAQLAESVSAQASTEDRFENMDVSFHEKLRQGFLDIAKKYPRRCRVLDAGQSMEGLAAQIAEIATNNISNNNW